MKNKKSYVYIGLPVLGMIFYLAYIRRSAIDMVYSDYIRLINSYLPDVWNPDKFFVADLLTRIPVNFLERGLNVMIFGYSVTVDRIMGILGFGLSALVIGRYSRKKELCPVWYAAMMIVMFSLNKWEMLYNGTGWAHFLAFDCFLELCPAGSGVRKGIPKREEIGACTSLCTAVCDHHRGGGTVLRDLHGDDRDGVPVYLRARYCNCKEFIWKISGKGRQTEFKQHG